MGLTVDNKGGVDFELVDPGWYRAICYRVVDQGTHHDKNFNKDKHTILVSWELVDTVMESDEQKRPFTIHNRYTASLNEKAHLHKDLVAWRGRPFSEEELAGFSLGNIIGAPAYLNVIHKQGTGKNKDKTYSNISVIGPLPGAMAGDLPSLVNPTLKFDLDAFDDTTFKKLSDGMQKKIAESKEYQAMLNQGGPETPHVTDEEVAAQLGHEDAERQSIQQEDVGSLSAALSAPSNAEIAGAAEASFDPNSNPISVPPGSSPTPF